METYVVTFTITVPFEEWVKAYDSSIDGQKEAGITSIYRGFLKYGAAEVILFQVQAIEDNNATGVTRML